MYMLRKIDALIITVTVTLLFATPVRSDIGDVENWVGHGTIYGPANVQPQISYLVTLVSTETAEMEISTVGTRTFENGNVAVTNCVRTFSENGKSVIECDDSSGEGIRIRSLIQRMFLRDDGTTAHVTITVNGAENHLERLRTATSAEGVVLRYSRDALDLID